LKKFYSLKDYPEIEPEIKNQIIGQAKDELRNVIIDFMYERKYIIMESSTKGINAFIDLEAMIESKEFREALECSQEQTKRVLNNLKKNEN
jgi:hypothetical protein